MKKLLIVAVLLFPSLVFAAEIPKFPPGYISPNGNQLNLMVAAVNNLTGNGTAGTVTIGNGTVALPSLAFGSDLDTGIYRIGANNLGVAANGAKVLDVGTTGLAVTGLLSATTTLSVTGASTLGKIITGATPPVLSSCGGSPTISGSDTAGRFVIGSAATACTVTFAAAYTGAPYCTITAEVATQPTYTVANTAISVATGIASTAYHYVCVARSGG